MNFMHKMRLGFISFKTLLLTFSMYEFSMCETGRLVEIR